MTSAFPKIFSAGLDLTEMHAPASREQLEVFWTAFQDLWLTLYTSPLAIVASINGTSPAAGCIVATTCDHRPKTQGRRRFSLCLRLCVSKSW